MAGDDWEDFDDEPTHLDTPPPELVETGKHRGGEFLAGREAGVSDGINATIRALAARMRARGSSEAEIALETGTVRAMAEDEA